MIAQSAMNITAEIQVRKKAFSCTIQPDGTFKIKDKCFKNHGSFKLTFCCAINSLQLRKTVLDPSSTTNQNTPRAFTLDQ